MKYQELEKAAEKLGFEVVIVVEQHVTMGGQTNIYRHVNVGHKKHLFTTNFIYVLNTTTLDERFYTEAGIKGLIGLMEWHANPKNYKLID